MGPCGTGAVCFVLGMTLKTGAIQCIEGGAWHVKECLVP